MRTWPENWDSIRYGEEIHRLSQRFALPETPSVLGMRKLIDIDKDVENPKLKISGVTLTTVVKGSVTYTFLENEDYTTGYTFAFLHSG
jgi:hypothetical protein